MVLEFFKYTDVAAFLAQYDFDGIEPFTLVLVDSDQENKVTELKWDANTAHIQHLDATRAHIWSSATLYPKEIAEQRAGWFDQWLAGHNSYEQQKIMEFHKYGGRGDLWNNFVMKRGDHLQTVSITSIQKNGGYNMIYDDLLSASVWRS